MRLDSTPLKPAIGSEVRADPRALIGGALGGELRALLIERGVLLFRDLDIGIAEQRAITASLGELRVDAGDGLQKVTLDAKESPEYAAFFDTTFFWHMDGHYAQTTPVFGASLRPARLPEDGGGQTEFLNAFAAYEGLPEADRKRIDGLRVVHSRLATMAAAAPGASEEEAARWRRTPNAVQPLVWEHESGRKSLMLGGSVSHVENMHPAESYDLLLRLRHHMSQPDYVYSHEWRMGDMILWHNIGTMHRVRPFDPASGRLLNRFSVMGEEQSARRAVDLHVPAVRSSVVHTRPAIRHRVVIAGIWPMFSSVKRSARAAMVLATAISTVTAGVASAQDYPPPPPPQQGYQGPPSQGYQAPPSDYETPPPPPGYDGRQPPPPPPGFQPDQEYSQQQGQDQRYEAYAEDWAQRNCVKSQGNAGAGALIGGLFGALLGSSIAGRHDRGAGAFVGGVAGAVGGAAVGSSSGGATSPGCPPGYVAARGAPAFYYEGAGDPYYYDAPSWYVPWIFIGGRWTFRPYPYHAYYWHHYGYGRGYGRGGYGRPYGGHRHRP